MYNRINAEEWIKEQQKIYNNTPLRLRPKTGRRPIKSRSESKSRALAWSCYYAWQKALKTGFIEEISGGYKNISRKEKSLEIPQNIRKEICKKG